MLPESSSDKCGPGCWISCRGRDDAVRADTAGPSSRCAAGHRGAAVEPARRRSRPTPATPSARPGRRWGSRTRGWPSWSAPAGWPAATRAPCCGIYVNYSDALHLAGRYAGRRAGAGRHRGRAQLGLERSMGAMLAGNAAEPLIALGEWDRAARDGRARARAGSAGPAPRPSAAAARLVARLAGRTGRGRGDAQRVPADDRRGRRYADVLRRRPADRRRLCRRRR